MASRKASWKGVRLGAAALFAFVPAILLPGFLAYLYNFRPHVTDVAAGYVEPHYSHGSVTYFTPGDETTIRMISIWLFVALVALILTFVQANYRPLLRRLQPPHDPALKPEEVSTKPETA